MVATVFASSPLQLSGRSLSRVQWAAAGGVVVAAHLAAAWALLQMREVREEREAVAPHAPLFVDWIASPPPPPLQPRPVAAPRPPAPQPHPQPRKSAPPPAPIVAAPMPQAPVPVAPPVAPRPPAVAAVDTPPAPPAQPALPEPPAVPPAAPAPAPAPAPTPTPVAPPQPRTVPATAVQYAVPPAPEYPAVSSRLRETGTVIVHVLIGEDGTAREVKVHRSSGHPRLDAAAVAALRRARFRPYTEDGRAVAVWAPAPIEFELEK